MIQNKIYLLTFSNQNFKSPKYEFVTERFVSRLRVVNTLHFTVLSKLRGQTLLRQQSLRWLLVRLRGFCLRHPAMSPAPAP